MTKKLQPVITITGLAYEPQPENYPGCKTIEEMRKIDEEQITEDPFYVMQDPKSETKIEVKIIEEENP